MDYAALEANYTPVDITPKKKKEVTGLKRFLIDALPTVGGAVGAVGGSFVAPVAGTAVGGAAGAGLGELLAQRLRGDDLDAGKIATNAVFGALPGAGKLLKGAGTALKGGAEVAEQAAKPGFLQRVGQRASETGSGLKAEPTVGGMAKLDQQSQFISKYPGTPRQQRIAMEKDMESLGQQVDDILTTKPVPMSGKEVQAAVKTAVDAPLKYPDVDLTLPGVQRNLSAHLSKFEQATDAKAVNDYVKQLNPIAKKAQAKIERGGIPTDKEAAALVAKRAGDEALSSIPEIAPFKKEMAQIFDITPQVAKAAEQKIGLPMAVGIESKAPVQVTKGILSRVGAKLLGTTPTGEQSLTRQVLGNLPGQAAAQGVGSILTAPDPQETAQEQADPAAQELAQSLLSTDNVEPQATNDPFGEESIRNAVLQDLQATGGKNVDKLLAIQERFGAQASKPQSAESAKVAGAVGSGLKSLDALEAVIAQGGVPGGTAVPGRGLLGGLGQSVLGTGEYDAYADNIADALVRLRTGAAATKEELDLYKRLLPQAFDSPELQAQKIRQVRDYFSDISGRLGGASTDLQQSIGGL